jgi:hypothetical protein
MIHGEATLSHHLLQVAAGELVAAIPSNAQKDDRWLEVPPLERRFWMLQEYDSGRKRD